MALVWFRRIGQHGHNGNEDTEAHHHAVIRNCAMWQMWQAALCNAGATLWEPGRRRGGFRA